MGVKKKTADEVVVAYKGFDSDWTCRGFQYEVGKTFEHDGDVAACESGFHACEYPLHVLRYYKPSQSVFAVVEQSGKLSRHEEDSKIASSKLTVTAQIDLAGLIKAAIKYTMDRCTPADCGVSKEANTSVVAQEKNESATASGEKSAAMASGRNCKAKGVNGAALFIVYRDAELNVLHAKALIVGRDGIKADTFYLLNELGEAVEAA